MGRRGGPLQSLVSQGGHAGCQPDSAGTGPCVEGQQSARAGLRWPEALPLLCGHQESRTQTFSLSSTWAEGTSQRQSQPRRRRGLMHVT